MGDSTRFRSTGTPKHTRLPETTTPRARFGGALVLSLATALSAGACGSDPPSPSAAGGAGAHDASGGAAGAAGKPTDGGGDGPSVDGAGGAGGASGAGGAAGGADAAGGASCVARDFSAVDAALDGAVADRTVPGLSFAIVERGCGIVHRHAAGSFALDAVVPIASASKVPAMTLLMALIDSGRLALEDTVAKHLGAKWATDKSAITVRMLMAHTSGLPAQVGCLGQTTSTLAACVDEIAEVPLAAAPGSTFTYGGADYQVAGRIAEVATGKSFNALFAEFLGDPCSLAPLSFAPSPQNNLGSDTNPRVAGGAASDADGYARLLALHLEGGRCGTTRVLTERALSLMRESATSDLPKQASPYDDGRDYGFGWWLEPRAAGAPLIVSDAGAFGTKPWLDAETGYAAILLIQRNTAAGERIYDRVAPTLARVMQ